MQRELVPRKFKWDRCRVWMSDESWAGPFGTPQVWSTLVNAVKPLWAWGMGIVSKGRGRRDNRYLES